jgi:hypothetical protein
MSTAPKSTTVASLRYQSDIRQAAGLLLATGIFAIVLPLTDVASLIDGSGNTPTTGIPFSLLFGGFCVIATGLGSVFVGYNQLVNDWGNKNITRALLIFLQTGYTLYITIMVDIAKKARTGAAFIPAEYEPSTSDVKFVGAMGILSVLSYAFTTVGSIAFFLFSLYAYQSGKPEQRPAGYYRQRQFLYCGMLALAGISQMLLGIYIVNMVGGGLLEKGPIGVAVYVVFYPAINVLLGAFQIYNAIWGIARASSGPSADGDYDKSFQFSVYVAWFLQIVLQVIVQIGYAPGATLAAATTTVLALSFGLNLMPAYLDQKMHTVPEVIEPSYYYDGASRMEPKDLDSLSDANTRDIEAGEAMEDITVSSERQERTEI